MPIEARRLTSQLYRGALFGAAAWSAYAVVEFVFSSVVYRISRPYATFTPWHWRLTALVIVGYVVCGLIAGALTGLAAARWRRDRPAGDILGPATTLVLVIGLLLNFVTGADSISGGAAQIATACVFLLLLVLEISSADWRRRLGWVANPWVVSATWLGVSLTSSILGMRLGTELGKRLDLAAAGVAGAILVAAVAALFLGRKIRHFETPLAIGSCSVAVLLGVVSLALSANFPSVAIAQSSPDTATARPNVVVIVMDTVRADHLSLYGYSRDTTPRLKELAQDSVVYDNAFAASDITLTSHASLFTGMYPSWHNAYSQPPAAVYGRELSARTPTLAELLRKEGYETLGVAANLYLRADFGLERGFDAFHIPRPVPLLPDEDRTMLRRPLRRVLSLVADTAQFDRLYTFGEDVNRELFTAIEHRARPAAPFFAFVNYMDAHFPYVPPAPYDHLFPGRHPGFTQDDLGTGIDAIARGQGEPPGYRAHCESQYDGGIAYVDAQIGKVVDWLKRRHAYDNTLIVVTSDHGEAFGEKNRTGHANSPYQNLLHTALLIKYPRGTRNGRETRPVSLIDVAPTILASLSVAVPATMQGIALGDGPPAPRRIFAETFQNPVAHSPDCPDGCVTKVLVEWPLKFVENQTKGRLELFDLVRDPHEEHNLFAARREMADPLAAHLTEWSKSMPAQSTEVKRVNPSIANTLRGNGYIAK